MSQFSITRRSTPELLRCTGPRISPSPWEATNVLVDHVADWSMST
jgi:hypothetical protein